MSNIRSMNDRLNIKYTTIIVGKILRKILLRIYIMAELDGYDSTNFANFDHESSEQQLPSLPVDDILPQADEANIKSVTFDDQQMTSSDQQDANIVLEKEHIEEDTTYDFFKYLAEYSPYIFALVFIFIAYWYSRQY